MSNINLIKEIRQMTSLSFKDIKKAVEELGSEDAQEVIDHLRKNGALKAQSRAGRSTDQGNIFTYSHEGRVGVMIEVTCETDFVARSDDFQALGKNLCLHTAAYQPKFVSEDQVDEAFIAKELEIAKDQLIKEGKDESIIDKILMGKKAKISKENTLLSQPFLLDTSLSVQDHISQLIQKTGENIQVKRFVIYSM